MKLTWWIRSKHSWLQVQKQPPTLPTPFFYTHSKNLMLSKNSEKKWTQLFTLTLISNLKILKNSFILIASFMKFLENSVQQLDSSIDKLSRILLSVAFPFRKELSYSHSMLQLFMTPEHLKILWISDQKDGSNKSIKTNSTWYLMYSVEDQEDA